MSEQRRGIVYTRTCPGCGESFTTQNKQRKFCYKNKLNGSRPCYWKWRHEKYGRTEIQHKVCPECDMPFDTYNSKQKYCNPHCYYLAWYRGSKREAVSDNNRRAIADMKARAAQ